MIQINITASSLSKLTPFNTYDSVQTVITELLVSNKLIDKYIPKSKLEECLISLQTPILIQISDFMKLPRTTSPYYIAKEIVKKYVVPSYNKDITELESKQLIDKNLPDILQILNFPIKKDLQMRRGNLKEYHNLNRYENKFKRKIGQRNSKLYTKLLYTDPEGKFQITIRGKVDGIVDDTIIESKNRTKRLFKMLRPYEKVQLEAYMFLTGMKKAVLTEYYNEESCVIEYNHDSQFWNDLCTRSIIPRVVDALKVYECMDFIDK